ncbi:MAG: thymidylate synthase [Thermofilaceae archaeon]
MRVLHFLGRSLPETWETAVSELWFSGEIVETEYGEKAKEAMAVIEVAEPFAEPRFHLKGIVGKVSEYIAEVVEGVHDAMVGQYGYTYHERLFSYASPLGPVNQIERIVEKLSKAYYTRRAIAVTWQPWRDLESEHPPCLVYLWFHSSNGVNLNVHAHMRSNDALKAAFMNMLAFTALQQRVAERLGMRVGKYIHTASSFHIYERDWKHAEHIARAVKEGNSGGWHLTTQQYLKLFERGNR